LIGTRNKGGYQGISHGRYSYRCGIIRTHVSVPYYCESRKRAQGACLPLMPTLPTPAYQLS